MKTIYIAVLMVFIAAFLNAGTEKPNTAEVLTRFENTDLESILPKLENPSESSLYEIKFYLKGLEKHGYRKKLFAALKDNVPDMPSDYNLLVELSGPWGPVYKGFFLADRIYYFSMSKGEINIVPVQPTDSGLFKKEEDLIRNILSEKTFYGDASDMGDDCPTFVISAVYENNFKTVIIHGSSFHKRPNAPKKFEMLLDPIDTFCKDILKEAPWRKKQKGG